MHGAECRADWRVSLPKAHSKAKMLVIKNPASFISKQVRTNGNITQNRITAHCCRIFIPLSGHISTNNNNNKLENNPQKALAGTAENWTPVEFTAVKWEGFLVWQRETVPPNTKRGLLGQKPLGIPEPASTLTAMQLEFTLFSQHSPWKLFYILKYF